LGDMHGVPPRERKHTIPPEPWARLSAAPKYNLLLSKHRYEFAAG
jgi:hypothetical protein